MHTCVSVYIYICFFFVCFFEYTCCLSNSLFLLDTGIFFCRTTSCRPCHRTFSPGFHCFSECSCFAWLSTLILCLSASVDFLSWSLLDMYWPVFLVFAYLCVLVSRWWSASVHRQTNRHCREISEIVPAHTHACGHILRSLAHPWAAVVTSVTLTRSRSSYTYMHRHTSMHFVCLLFWVYLTAGCLNLIRCRSSYNHTHQHAYVCVCMYVYKCSLFCLLFWVYLTLVALISVSLRYRTLYLYNNQLSALPPDIFAGLSSLRWVCVSRDCVSRGWVLK